MGSNISSSEEKQWMKTMWVVYSWAKESWLIEQAKFIKLPQKSEAFFYAIKKTTEPFTSSEMVKWNGVILCTLLPISSSVILIRQAQVPCTILQIRRIEVLTSDHEIWGLTSQLFPPLLCLGRYGKIRKCPVARKGWNHPSSGLSSICFFKKKQKGLPNAVSFVHCCTERDPLSHKTRSRSLG